MIYAIETKPSDQVPRLVGCFEGPPDAIRWAAERFGLTVGDTSGMQTQLQQDEGYLTFGPDLRHDGERVALIDLQPQGAGIDQGTQIEQVSRHLLGYSGIPSQQGSRVISVAQLIEPLPFGTEDEYAAAELVNRSELIDGLTRAGWPSMADDVRHRKHPLPVLMGRAYVNEAPGAVAVIAAHMIRAEAALREQRGEQAAADRKLDEAPDRALELVRNAGEDEPEQAVRMVAKLDRMAARLEDELGLDAEDALTWHVRQLLLNESAVVDHLHQMARDHLTAAPVPGTDQRYPHQLGDRMRDWFEERCGVGGLALMQDNPSRSPRAYLEPDDDGALELPEFASVLVQAALPWIDWRALAVEFIESYKREAREGAEAADQQQAEEIRGEAARRS